MGWTYGPKPHNVRAELTRKLTWETATHRTRCLDLALTLRVAYAAVETVEKATGQREVWAAVILLDYVRDPKEHFNFGVKELDETVGPRECDCPERILDVLTTTGNENARAWRLECRARLNRPRMPPPGTRVRFEEPMRFKDGAVLQEFVIESHGRGRRRLRGTNGGLYTIPRTFWKNRTWKPVVDPGHTREVESRRTTQMGLL